MAKRGKRRRACFAAGARQSPSVHAEAARRKRFPRDEVGMTRFFAPVFSPFANPVRSAPPARWRSRRHWRFLQSFPMLRTPPRRKARTAIHCVDRSRRSTAPTRAANPYAGQIPQPARWSPTCRGLWPQARLRPTAISLFRLCTAAAMRSGECADRTIAGERRPT